MCVQSLSLGPHLVYQLATFPYPSPFSLFLFLPPSLSLSNYVYIQLMLTIVFKIGLLSLSLPLSLSLIWWCVVISSLSISLPTINLYNTQPLCLSWLLLPSPSLPCLLPYLIKLPPHHNIIHMCTLLLIIYCFLLIICWYSTCTALMHYLLSVLVPSVLPDLLN